MNIVILLINFWSYRRELAFVTYTVILLLLLPILAVFTITNTGIQIVSDALIDTDPTTQTIQIKNPTDGSILSEITTPIIWPVQGVITLKFGESSIYQPFHTGLDIANAKGYIGDPIHPAMPGTVTHVGDISWGYGKHVIIDHDNHLTTTYAHLCCVYAQEGQQVTSEDVIGGMGSTGWSTGSHLHFEVRVLGVPVNPNQILFSSK